MKVPLKLNLLLIFLVLAISSCKNNRQTTLNIADDGWRLLPDTKAEWKNDSLYLPDEVNLAKLPVNPPTGGWEALNDKAGMEVKLPSTVEEHYWGKWGLRDYDHEYCYETVDKAVKNGNYVGVSWWWKKVDVPAGFKNKKAILFIRGARFRAEVYMNKKLVGYNIIEETSFTCDVSDAIIPGQENLLAIRITNPGGRLDWIDTELMKWGKYEFHKSRGFGGLDRGITLTAHEPVYFKDLYVLNTPTINKIDVHAIITNTTNENFSGALRYEMTDPDNHSLLIRTDKEINLAPLQTLDIAYELTNEQAVFWSVQNPKLYNLKVSIITSNKIKDWNEATDRTFGFRWFEPDGIGENAVLRLNGDRIRLISAISWGFWGHNGLFPTPELAEREVKAAKTFGMNCIQFHRNVGKTEVLDLQDKLGLLRYMEPGGGVSALGTKYSVDANSPDKKVDNTGANGEPRTFAEKFMEEKIMHMIRDHRSHPSLIMYSMQNEIAPDLRNPRIFHIIKRMHEEDPSRIIVLKSGIPPINQVWVKPYGKNLMYDEGNGYSGWWDRHTVGGPGTWQDNMYVNTDSFTHNPNNDEYFKALVTNERQQKRGKNERQQSGRQKHSPSKEIMMWGEMLGSAVCDNHEKIVNEIKSGIGTSYDLKEHEDALNAYNKFLDKWKFRPAFKTAGDLFLNIGDKCYDFWGRVIESARLSEDNDYLVISGWETTAIEDHSGLLDNLRHFKGNPELMSKRFAQLRPVVKPHKLVVAQGSKTVVDLFLLNETNKAHGKKYKLTIIAPDGKKQDAGIYDAPDYQKDKFVYLIAKGVETPVFANEGEYKLRFESLDNPEIFSEDGLLVVSTDLKIPVSKQIAVNSDSPELQNSLALMGVKAEAYNPEKNYDLIITSFTKISTGNSYRLDPKTRIKNTEDEELYRSLFWGDNRNLDLRFSDLPKGKVKVTLYFSELEMQEKGKRLFDVAINGKTVLKDFDIFATAGGMNVACSKTFTVNAPDGIIDITMPNRKADYGYFNAIKIEAGKKIIAVNCGGEAYTDKHGMVWGKYAPPVNLNKAMLDKVKDGASLIILSEGESLSDTYGKALADAGILKYNGIIGTALAPWMGSWYFVREHPVYVGLPVNCAMKSYYQVPVFNATGIMVDGDNVEIIAGYSKDHDCNIGAGTFLVKYGKGKILMHTIPGIVNGAKGIQTGMQPVMAKRLLLNSIEYLTK